MKQAGQPQIIRAYQRDEEYRQWLRYAVLESLELGSILPYRIIHNYRAEWAVASDFIYFTLTTLQGK